jgi:hypothetical protein
MELVTSEGIGTLREFQSLDSNGNSVQNTLEDLCG